MVVFDATTLLLVLSANVAVPLDSKTGKPIEHGRERVEFLLSELQKKRTQIVIPTPALAEILVRAGAAGPPYLEKIRKSASFRIVDFDERAAIEVALMTRAELVGAAPRDRTETLAKLKYDRQIVAIAKVEGAKVIYSDDRKLRNAAIRSDIQVVPLEQLPLPPSEPPETPDLFKGTEGDAKTEPEAETDEGAERPQPREHKDAPGGAISGDGGGTGVRSEPGEVRKHSEADGKESAAKREEKLTPRSEPSNEAPKP